uniref:Transthyretin-like family protein n=1 Tax=Strongyloides papillosus TaxID=174720 RepID=A0A0N5BI16_STREA
MFRIGVKGIAICNGRPHQYAKVVLAHHYKWKGTRPKIMDGEVTQSNGRFSLSGSMQTFMAMVPFVSIIHRCGQSKGSRCRKITNVKIAPELLFKGRSSRYEKYLGLVDLSTLPVQKIVCE